MIFELLPERCFLMREYILKSELPHEKAEGLLKTIDKIEELVKSRSVTNIQSITAECNIIWDHFKNKETHTIDRTSAEGLSWIILKSIRYICIVYC
jgi:hypothetical protein